MGSTAANTAGAQPIPEAGALPAPALDSLITQVRELDMDELKAKIAEEEAASGTQA